MKKLQLLFVLCSIPLFATSPSNEDLQREVDQLKFRVDRLTSGSEMPIESGSVTSSAWGFSISADLLFWQTQSDFINYAYEVSQTYDTVLPQSNQYHETEIDWAWGFRVGAGYQFEFDNWKLAAEYTYLRPKGNSSRAIANNQAGSFSLSGQSQGIRSNWATNSILAAKSVQSQYDLNYDYVTLQLARNFCVTKYIEFDTHWGLAAGWITETQENTYTGGTDAGFLNTSSLVNKNDNNYWGIGPVAGLGAFWHMGLGFSLMADITAEILVGKNRVSHIEQVNGSSEDYVKIVYASYRYRPQLFMQIGLAYDAYFNNASQHFGLRAGWENQIWFSQAVNLSENLSERYGDIQFSGFTLKALFAF